MTYKLLFVALLSFLFTQANAQDLIDIKKKAPCFQKSLDRKGQRYPDWECGLSDSLVDCGEGLEMDPGTNTVYNKKTGSPFSGYCESCHMNGIRQRLVYFSGGKQSGIDTTYYESGCPQVVSSHIGGSPTGVWTYYNDSSNLEAWQMGYLNGEKHGKEIHWKQFITGKNADGFSTYQRDTTKIEYYTNGKLNGTKTTYWKNSKLRKEVNYEMGVLEGSFKTYTNKGVLLEDLNYKAGKKDGEFKYFYDNGAPLKTEHWKEGVKNGNFTVFYIQGFVQSSENYKKGKKEGWFEERFYDNKVKRQALYKKDELIEEHVFDEYGNEIRTVGETASKATEDDAIPTDAKAKKKAAKAKAKAEKKRLKAEKKRLKAEAKAKGK